MLTCYKQMNVMMLVGQYNALMTAITPAKVIFENGVPFAPDFNDVFHSVDGGVDQSRSVFLNGNGLPERWLNQSTFQILETGFGIGLNFLVTWNAWRNTVDVSTSRLHFVSFEKHPLTGSDLARILRPYLPLSSLSSALIAAWPPLVAGVHQLEFEQGHLILTLVLGDIQNTLPQFAMAADAVFLDGFSPEKNHEMWNDRVIRHVARQSRYQGTLATWCVTGAVRRLLELHGYTVQRRPGFGRKRERLEARFNRIPAQAFERMVTPARNPVLARVLHPHIKQRGALIVGAGIAGCLMAERLSQSGWHVDLFDRRSGPAQEASGNPAGIIRPVLSLDDNLASRLGRAAFFQTLRTLQRLQNQGRKIRFKQCGVLVLAVDEAEASLQRSIIAHQCYPPDYVAFMESADARKLGGVKTDWGGWYFPKGGWVDPGSLCSAALAEGGDRIRTHWNTDIAQIHKTEVWHVLNSQGHVLAEASVLIMALGSHAQTFAQTAWLPLTVLRGQITQLAQDPFPLNAPVLCHDGYVIPGLENKICIGATYDNDLESEPRSSSTQENLERLKRLIPDWNPAEITTVDRVGFRSVTRDRMPLIGAVSSEAGLYAVMGMGSRGLVLSSIAAELIATELEGSPLPLEKDLIKAVAPSRFDPALSLGR